MEEVGRMVGYDSITPHAPLVPAIVPPGNPERALPARACALLFVDQGFTEVYNYSLPERGAARAFGFDPAAHMRVANPIARDQELMRATLLPGIWRNIARQRALRDSFRLFEIGQEIHKRPEGLPDEIPHLVRRLYDRKDDGGQVFELKRAGRVPAARLEAWPVEARAYEHPARTAELVWKGEVVGRLFELHPSMLENGRAAILDLDLAALVRLTQREQRFEPIRRYPSSAFDLSVVAGRASSSPTIAGQLTSRAGEGLDRIEFVRVLPGPPLAEGKKSVSFRLTVSAPDRTLSSEEVGQIRSRLIESMREAGYELRV